MELKEFVRLDPKQIRRDNTLMQLYVDFHRVAFSFAPKCEGCSFKRGFNKLKKYAESEKITTLDVNKKPIKMKTFELKKEFNLKILSFKKDGKTYRSYGYRMTEEFALELAKQKKEVFKTLPADAVVEEKKKYADMDYMTEIIPLYNELSSRNGIKAESRKKADILAYLDKYGN